MKPYLVAAVLLALTAIGRAQALPGEVLSHQKISDTEGGFTGTLVDLDLFGLSVAALGDLDGDGIGDLAVGTITDTGGGLLVGAVWVLFLEADGTVKGHQRITAGEGGFTGLLETGDGFGSSLAGLGDLDGDGVRDLAVGASGDDDARTNSGAVWILFLDADGTVKSHQKISNTEGGFTGGLLDYVNFGSALSRLDDLDGDGVDDLAVGAAGDDDDEDFNLLFGVGAVWVLFLESDGTVKEQVRISEEDAGFTGSLDQGDSFGSAVATPGDLDGDGVCELAVGASGDDAGGTDRGAVWVLFLNDDGSVRSHQEISATQGGFTGTLDDFDAFSRPAALGDLDGDGVFDLAVGAPGDDDGGDGRGAAWVLFLESDGTVKNHRKISDTAGGFTGVLDDGDSFGRLASLGDHDGDGVPDLAVGVAQDDDGGEDRGAVWLLFLTDGQWVDIGNGLAGTHGIPTLAGEGVPVGGASVTVTLSGALELSSAALVIGLTDPGLPFKGGVLVPSPDVLVTGLTTDGTGSLELSGTWPAGIPSRSSFFIQDWIVDPAGPAGFSASNALVTTTP